MGAADRLATVVLGRPRAFLVLSLLLTAILAAGLYRLDFSTDYRVFFDPDGPARQSLERLERAFGVGESVVVVLRPTEEETVFTPKVLRATRALQARFAADPAVTRTASVLDLPVRRIVGGFPETGPAVLPDAEIDDETADAVRGRALGDPTAAGRLVRRDGRALSILMAVETDDDLRAVTDRLRAIERSFRAAHPGIETGMTGIALLNDGFIQSTISDLQLFMPITILVLVVAMAAFLRSGVGVVGTLAVVVMAAAGAMGTAGWLGIHLTPAAAGAPTVIMTIAIASSIHIMISFTRRHAEGMSRRKAVRESCRINLQPVFLTSLTTLFGLLSLNFAAAPPFRDLGNIAAVGIALAFVHSVVFLPALIALWPVRRGPAPVSRSTQGLAGVAGLVLRRPRTIFLVIVAGGLALGALVPRLTINDVYFRYLDEDLPVRQGTDFTFEHLPSACTLHWILDGGTVLAPGYLERVDSFARFLSDQPFVHHVLNPVDFIRRETGGALPDDPGRARTVLEGARLTSNDPAAIRLLFADDGRRLHVMATIENSGSSEVQRLSERSRAYLDAHMPEVTDRRATGACFLFANIAETNIRSMLGGTLVAFFLVSLTLVAALRSVWFGILSLLPNILPPVMAFGLWSLLVGQVGLAASVTAATALGIIVDATIHLMTRYRRARKAGAGVDEAIRDMLAGVGAAVWVAAVIVIGGFAVLALSSFEVNRDLGLLTALTLSAALLTDFLLLPALLKIFDRSD